MSSKNFKNEEYQYKCGGEKDVCHRLPGGHRAAKGNNTEKPVFEPVSKEENSCLTLP